MVPVTPILWKWILLLTVPLQGQFISTDHLGHLYYAIGGNTFIKADSSGKEIFRYQQNRFGILHSADVTNPFKTVLCFEDYSVIVVTDQTLSELVVYPLAEKGIRNYSAACFSPSDNGIWIFDSGSFILKKMDSGGTVWFESADMISLLGKAPQVEWMQEYDQKIYLADATGGILVFDVYGNYINRLSVNGVRQFQIFNHQLMFQEKDKIQTYDLQRKEWAEFMLPKSGAVSFRVEQKKLFLQTTDTVFLYTLP